MDHPGEVIKSWRNAEKKSIFEIARKSRIDKGTISRFENCGNFEMRVFRALCNAFGKSLGDAYAEMATAKPSLVAASVCPENNPEHISYHTEIENILHEYPNGEEIIRVALPCLRSMIEAALGPPPERKHGPGRPIDDLGPGRPVSERKKRSA